MAKHNYKVGEILELANEKKKIASKLGKLGFWRMARDDKRHSHTLKRIVRRLKK